MAALVEQPDAPPPDVAGLAIAPHASLGQQLFGAVEDPGDDSDHGDDPHADEAWRPSEVVRRPSAAADDGWPAALAEELRYDVLKLNNLRENFHSRRDRRVLSLRPDGLRHVKVSRSGADLVRRFHPYGDVAATYLVGADKLCVSYFNDVDYEYVTPLAPQVARELAARVDASRRRGGEDDGARAVLPRRRRGPAVSDAALLRAPPGKDGSARPPAAPRSLSRRARKLEAMTGESEEARIGVALSKILLDAAAPEGRAVKRFVHAQSRILAGAVPHVTLATSRPRSGSRRDSAKAKARGAPIRAFVDGLHDYMMEHRLAEFESLAVDAPVRRRRSSLRVLGGGDDDGAMPSVEETLARLLEDCVVVPLLPALQKRLGVDASAEARFAARRLELRAVPPAKLGLPRGLDGAGYWRPAARALGALDASDAPNAQLGAVVDAARCIHDEHAALVRARDLAGGERGDGAVPTFLAADDFLPVLIFAVVHASLDRRPLLARATLWALADPLMLQSEPGYYLTMFDAAVEYVSSGDARRDAAAEDEPEPRDEPRDEGALELRPL